MDNRILSLKYRPRTWDELVGNQLYVRMLRNSVARGHIKPAYFFSGGRGGGKTSTVRVLAKAILCTAAVNGNPCNACQTCLEVDAGTCPDVMEIDAATENRVENIRELLETLHFAPQSGRRIIILDECHALSTAAGTALLKTLEEPPKHVVFMFCTTDPDRVLETLVSRCLRFDFRRISVDEILNRLVEVADKEGIQFDHEALRLMAEAANGSVRDALTTLDQCRMLEERVSMGTVEGVLGLVPFRDILTLFDAVAANDSTRALEWVDAVAAGRGAVETVTSTLLVIQQLILLKTNSGRALRVPQEIIMPARQVASSFELSRLVSMASAARGAINDVRRRVIPDPLAVVHLMVAAFSVRGDASPGAQVQQVSLTDWHDAISGVKLSRVTILRQHFDGEVLRVEE